MGGGGGMVGESLASKAFYILSMHSTSVIIHPVRRNLIKRDY